MQREGQACQLGPAPLACCDAGDQNFVQSRTQSAAAAGARNSCRNSSAGSDNQSPINRGTEGRLFRDDTVFQAPSGARRRIGRHHHHRAGPDPAGAPVIIGNSGGRTRASFDTGARTKGGSVCYWQEGAALANGYSSFDIRYCRRLRGCHHHQATNDRDRNLFSQHVHLSKRQKSTFMLSSWRR